MLKEAEHTDMSIVEHMARFDLSGPIPESREFRPKRNSATMARSDFKSYNGR